MNLVRLAFHEVEASPGLVDWLDADDVSLAFTNGNRLFLVGRQPDGRLSVVERQYGMCTAVAAVGSETLYLATRYQVWRLENALAPGVTTVDGHDRFYVPQTAWTTGQLGIPDLDVDGGGRPVFVSRRFSCLATVSETLNFTPTWVPPFVTALSPDDRCGLSGLAQADGRPAFVTSASQADTPDGWREERRHGGVLLAMPDGSVVAGGLSLPHSPRLHQGRVWLANGGTGELGVVDVVRGSFEPVAALPGLVRGLAIHGQHAAVGVSRPMWGETFEGLDVADRLERTGEVARCGVFVVGVGSGLIEHWLVLTGVAPDIGAVALLRGAVSPACLAFQGAEAEEWVVIPSEE